MGGIYLAGFEGSRKRPATGELEHGEISVQRKDRTRQLQERKYR